MPATGSVASVAPDAASTSPALDLQSVVCRARRSAWRCVDRDLRYVYINDRLAGYHGRPAAEHIGRTLREMIARHPPISSNRSIGGCSLRVSRSSISS